MDTITTAAIRSRLRLAELQERLAADERGEFTAENVSRAALAIGALAIATIVIVKLTGAANNITIDGG